MHKLRAVSLLLSGASVLALASTAWGQTATPTNPQEVTPGATSSTASAPATTAPASANTPAPLIAQVSEVVVTGSRVITNGNNSPTPVSVVSTAQLLEARPGLLVEAINDLPVFSGSRSSTGNPGSGVTNAAADELNLRNLGYYRTLVLFDGHRVPPSTYDQVVDVDMIPQMLVQRVDVVTGGASAVYGSDAVSGVVNFVTDSHFNGLKMDVEGSVSTYGDDATANVGIAGGTPFADGRGHIEGSYQFINDPGISRRSDRAWGRDVWTTQGSVPGSTYAAGTAQNPFALVENTRISTTSFGGLISGGSGALAALNGKDFAQNGVLSPFVNGAPTGTTGYQSGGEGGYYDGSLKAALQTNQVFMRVDYDLTNNIHAYFEGSDTLNHTMTYGQYNLLNKDVISGQDAFLPTTYQSAGTFALSKLLSDAPRIDTNTHENQFFLNGGLTGTFGNGYKWDVSLTHSQSSSTTANDNNINNQRLAAALDAVTNSSGQVVCRASLTNSAYAGCVPLNPFGPTSDSSSAMKYITQETQFTVTTILDDANFGVSGAPFRDWAGPVTMSLSGELRNLTYAVSSTALPSQLADCTSLLYNCTTKTALYADSTLANLPQVGEAVEEGAYEVEVPLLKDAPFAKDVSFNGAVRYANYSVSGGALTWKVGGVWQIDDQLKLRATRSHDFRAPTLYDLYQPQSVSQVAYLDDLTGNSPLANVHAGGNPNLKPEIGDTSSAGFVYQPHWLPRFSFSIDAYYIKVTNAIATASGYSPTVENTCYTSGGTSPYCSLIVRSPATGQVTDWYTESINIANVTTYGADFEGNYAVKVLGNPLSLRALVTWQPHIIYVTPGLDTVDQAGSGLNANNLFPAPRVRSTVFLNYQVNNFRIGLDERIRSSISFVNDAVIHVVNQPLAPLAYTDLNLSYLFSTPRLGHAELFLNIQNLLNTPPPPIAGVQANANVGTFGGFATGVDDPIGRYFTMGVRIRL